MILVDTSIWIDHLRKGHPHLRELLDEGLVLIHPFVIGELSSGQLSNRKVLLELLHNLPAAVTAEHEEVMDLLETKRLFGLGLGWVDLHLLTSALKSRAPLWAADRRLAEAAQSLRIAYLP